MSELQYIKKDETIKLEPYLLLHMNPNYIFIPINKGSKLRVSDNTYVYKNDIVMFDDKGKSIHSSISGKVLGVKDMEYISGIKPSIVIENDFKENIRFRKSAKKYISTLDKKEFIDMLNDLNLTCKDGYVVDYFNNIDDNLIINGIEKEPYMGNKIFNLMNADGILEMIDYLDITFKYKRVILAIPNNDTDLVNSYMNLIGTYPNIELKLVSDYYPVGDNNILAKELNINNYTMISVNTIYDLYTLLKKQYPVTEKLITITGNAIKPRKVVRVKIGSLLSEVFINNFDFTEKCVDVYINGTMSGNIAHTLKYVIDDDIEGIIVNKEKDKTELECVNCGLCDKACPMRLNPKYVLDKKGKCKIEYKNSCIKCGLCNHVCPSNINIMKYMGDNYE